MWKTHINICKTHLLCETSLNYLFMKMFVGSDLKRVNENEYEQCAKTSTCTKTSVKMSTCTKNEQICTKTDESRV